MCFQLDNICENLMQFKYSMISSSIRRNLQKTISPSPKKIEFCDYFLKKSIKEKTIFMTYFAIYFLSYVVTEWTNFFFLLLLGSLSIRQAFHHQMWHKDSIIAKNAVKSHIGLQYPNEMEDGRIREQLRDTVCLKRKEINSAAKLQTNKMLIHLKELTHKQ